MSTRIKSTRDIVVSALWDGFVPQISTGDPVYFCFSRDLIRLLLEAKGLVTDDCTKLICDIASDLVEVTESDVELHASAFEKNDDGFTPVIVLVAQQVLAVEEMVDDPQGFSENAYFPRLRALISPTLKELSVNPFSFDEFEKIWRVFAAEIRSICGNTEASISFRFGVYTGANKAKSFPLSQALLTREDLFTLVRRIEHAVVISSSADDLLPLVRHEASYLSRRAQKLLSIKSLSWTVVEQLRAFAAAVSFDRFVVDPVDKTIGKSFQLGIFKDSADWLSEEYRPFLYDEGTRERVEDIPTILGHLGHTTDSGAVTFMAISGFGDYWLRSRAAVDLAAGDTVLALCSTAKEFEIRSSCPLLVDQIESVATGLLSGCPEYTVVEFRMKSDSRRDLVVSRGRVVERKSTGSKSYMWVGGVSLDTRAHRFLRDALPTSIQFNDFEFDIEEMVAVNDRPFTFERLLEEVAGEDADASYEIEFPGKHEAVLSIGIRRLNFDGKMGFLSTAARKIVPFADAIPPGAAALIGFDDRAIAHEPLLSVHDAVNILRDFTNRSSNVLSADYLPELERRLYVQAIPRGVKQLLKALKRRISLTGSIS